MWVVVCSRHFTPPGPRKSTSALVASQGIPQLLHSHPPPPLRPQAVVKALVIHEVEDPESPTTSHNLHPSRCPACGMERKCSKCHTVGAAQVGRKCSCPTPPILRQTLAQASLIGKKEKTRTSEHSLAHGASCTARGWWVGGWPQVCVKLADVTSPSRFSTHLSLITLSVFSWLEIGSLYRAFLICNPSQLKHQQKLKVSITTCITSWQRSSGEASTESDWVGNLARCSQRSLAETEIGTTGAIGLRCAALQNCHTCAALFPLSHSRRDLAEIQPSIVKTTVVELKRFSCFTSFSIPISFTIPVLNQAHKAHWALWATGLPPVRAPTQRHKYLPWVTLTLKSGKITWSKIGRQFGGQVQGTESRQISFLTRFDRYTYKSSGRPVWMACDVATHTENLQKAGPLEGTRSAARDTASGEGEEPDGF